MFDLEEFAAVGPQADEASLIEQIGALERGEVGRGRAGPARVAGTRSHALRLGLSGLLPGVADHPLAQLERILLAAGHGIGQLS